MKQTPAVTATMPVLLVSILNFNAADDCVNVVRQIDAMPTTTPFALEIVDCGSDPGVVEAITMELPATTVRPLGRNLGFAGGNSVVLEAGFAAGYSEILLVNPDVDIPEGAIDAMVRIARMPRADPCIVGACEVLRPERQNCNCGFGGFSLWRGSPMPVQKPARIAYDCESLEVFAPLGFFLLVTKDAYDRGLRLDPRLFLYFEECDLGLQCKALRIHCYCAVRAAVVHNTRAGTSSGTAYYLARNRFRLVQRHGSRAQRGFYLVYSLFYQLPRSVFRTLRLGQISFAKAILQGWGHGAVGRFGQRPRN